MWCRGAEIIFSGRPPIIFRITTPLLALNGYSNQNYCVAILSEKESISHSMTLGLFCEANLVSAHPCLIREVEAEQSRVAGRRQLERLRFVHIF